MKSLSIYLLLSWFLSSAALSQIKKTASINILANDKLDREELTINGNRILTKEVNELIKKDYNGKLEKPSIQVDILNDYHEVGAYQIIFNFTVNTPKNYKDDNLCSSVCNILENEFLKLDVKTGNCDCNLVMKK